MEDSSRQYHGLVYSDDVFRAVRILILLLTWVGLSFRAVDLPVRIHDAHQEVCDHSHEHKHDGDSPCDGHHHCHCPSLSPMFCLPEFPVVSGNSLLLVIAAESEQIQWGLPDEPVYTPEVPPIIS